MSGQGGAHVRPEWVLVTGSEGKAREVQRILGAALPHFPVQDLPEVQAVDLETVVAQKAETAFRILGRPVIVEDTGLFVHAWGGLPGALVRWFLASAGPEGICTMLSGFDDRLAHAQTVVAAFDGQLRTYSGQVAGRIAPYPRGSNGFGWDSIFIPEHETRTFAEMADKEKSVYSMRRIAFEQLRGDLEMG